MNRRSWILLISLAAVLAAYWWLRPKPPLGTEAYVGERSISLLSSMAQVRETLATLRYGEKVLILKRRGELAQVHTAAGLTGWVDARALMDAELWRRGARLLDETGGMIVQARGHTKTTTNVRVEAGREAPRLFQFTRDTPVEVVARTAADRPPSGEDNSSKENGDEEKPKREDWLLVRGRATATPDLSGISSPAERSRDAILVAGWVLGRFIELALPDTVRDYASSAGMRVIAWMELNRVVGPNGEVPQYLVAGGKGPEGQVCDFTMLRVYTWGAARKRYETAYVESVLCGKLPIRVARTKAGDPEFRFAEADAPKGQERVYVMKQTVVRRVRTAEQARGRRQ